MTGDGMDGGPLLLQPALKVKVWGGRRLATAGVALPDAQPYGEAWLLHDSATVAQGPLAGRSLGDLLQQHGAALAGPEGRPCRGLAAAGQAAGRLRVAVAAGAPGRRLGAAAGGGTQGQD